MIKKLSPWKELSEIIVPLLRNFQDKHVQNSSGMSYDEEHTPAGLV